jgi:hypothetical protein
MSSNYVLSLSKALRHKPFEEIHSSLSPRTTQALAKPNNQSWWPLEPVDEVYRCVLQRFSHVGAYQFAKSALELGIGRVAMPLLQVAIAIGGSNPASVFRRAPQLMTVAARGVRPTWISTADRTGRFSINYDDPVPACAEQIWCATFDFTYLLAKSKGKSVLTERSQKHLVFELSWTP